MDKEFTQFITGLNKVPKKGVDYMTPSEIAEMTKKATPIKGVHYRDGKDGKDGRNGKNGSNGLDGTDGKDGKDGKSVDGDVLINRLLKEIPKPEKETPQTLASKINILEKAISYKVLKDVPTNAGTTVEDVVAALKNPKGKYRLNKQDIVGMPINMNDMRWHNW